MKINTKKIMFALSCALSHAHMHGKEYNDTFEQEFKNSMDQIQKEFDHATKSMKELHDAMLSDDFSSPINHLHTKNLPFNNPQNQNTSHYYQQSSSSLSFMNKDKAIKIVEQKDNQKVIYLITVTDKTSDDTQTTEPSDTATDLQKLAAYTKKAFHSQPADKILQECISALQEDQKDRVMHVETVTNGNETKYTVEIAHKTKPNADTKVLSKKQSRKDKKLAKRS